MGDVEVEEKSEGTLRDAYWNQSAFNHGHDGDGEFCRHPVLGNQLPLSVYYFEITRPSYYIFYHKF